MPDTVDVHSKPRPKQWQPCPQTRAIRQRKNQGDQAAKARTKYARSFPIDGPAQARPCPPVLVREASATSVVLCRVESGRTVLIDPEPAHGNTLTHRSTRQRPSRHSIGSHLGDGRPAKVDDQDGALSGRARTRLTFASCQRSRSTLIRPRLLLGIDRNGWAVVQHWTRPKGAPLSSPTRT